MCVRNARALGARLIDDWIDGTVRRRSFGLPPPARVFAEPCVDGKFLAGFDGAQVFWKNAKRGFVYP
jgi:hypothetical protein